MPCQNASDSTEIKPRKGNYLKNKGLCKCPDFKIPFFTILQKFLYFLTMGKPYLIAHPLQHVFFRA